MNQKINKVVYGILNLMKEMDIKPSHSYVSCFLKGVVNSCTWWC